ncbi:Rhomboid protease GlpG [Novipirellula aureliae]|uniref:Rhomboid protease GlpG n=1 Tax=Novipirellula aureliae TaxID=2527966 RepID=A0A5C6DL63_9BACT|nr:rhomboid family intramembrane serine protease [Novipirellula aureliae]TWU36547.1 Rhomboid protease GlpG [Novipirellula aureliae]
MRRIGTLDNENLARRFGDFLVTQSIDATVEKAAGAGQGEVSESLGWEIWIREEKDVDQAREAIREFELNPNDQRYQVSEEAQTLRNQRVAQEHRRQQEMKKLQRSMPKSRSGGSNMQTLGVPGKQEKIPVVIAVIVLSALASFGTDFGRPRNTAMVSGFWTEAELYLGMSFVDQTDPDYIESGNTESSRDSFASIRKGQVWRLVTPMFLHGDTMHLLFNMIWIFVLGSAIERLQGSVFLAVLLIVTQIAGMMLQVMLPGVESLPPFLSALAGSPFAIGASGAVYGLFGYLWIRPTLDPGYPIHMAPMNVLLMLGWLVFCMTGMFGNIANGAHLGGLLAGIAVAYFVSPRRL